MRRWGKTIIGGAGLLIATAPLLLAAGKKPPAGGTAPKGASAGAGSFTWGADEIEGTAIKGGGLHMTLTGSVRLDGQGRSITGKRLDIDVPKKANDITRAEGRGDIRLRMSLPKGNAMTAEGQHLVYHRESGEIEVDGAVHLHSDLAEGGTVDATGDRATVQTTTNQATLNGNVHMTLVKPDTLEGPAQASGQSMAVDLNTGRWKLSGGTQGEFSVKPKSAGP